MAFGSEEISGCQVSMLSISIRHFNSNADYNVLFREPAATATLSVSEVFTTSSFFILAVISQFGMTFTNRAIQNTSTNISI